jgi:hypothetical protein
MDLKPGDKVTRMIAGTIPCELPVRAITDEFIYLGPPEWDLDQCWKFDREYGYEIDEDLGWGMQTSGPKDGEIVTGSYIIVPGQLNYDGDVVDTTEIVADKITRLLRPPIPEADPPDAA